MDVLSDVLRLMRLSGSMLFLVEAHRPWMSWAPRTESFRSAVMPASQHLVSFHVITQGCCWAGLRDAPPERFETGDVLVVPHGDAYFLADPVDAPADYGPEQVVGFFRGMAAGKLPSVVREGSRSGERTQFICGFLGCDLKPFNPVLEALPAMVHLRGATRTNDRMSHLTELALCELREPALGGQSVLLRVAELMFVEVVRRHLETIDHARTGWLAGLHDPVIARALSLLHRSPASHWTLEALAQQVGTSRSVLAERFGHCVGQAPMHYLAHWRMQLATRLLAEPGPRKVAAVAQAVGYESEAAFSRAFKKCTGVAPADWRSRRAGASE